MVIVQLSLILCDNGQMWDARTICRKLWETAITLKYISLDPEKYVRLYKNFGLLSYERQFDRLPACMKDGDEVKRMHEAYSSRVAELPDYRRDENGRIQKNFYSYWSGKNLHDMAVDAKVDEIYSPRAFVLHNSTHINTIGSDAFFESDTLKYGPPNQDRDLPMLVCEACHYMLMVASLVCEAHEFKLKESCDSFRRAIEQLLPEALDVAFGARSEYIRIGSVAVLMA